MVSFLSFISETLTMDSFERAGHSVMSVPSSTGWGHLIVSTSTAAMLRVEIKEEGDYPSVEIWKKKRNYKIRDKE